MKIQVFNVLCKSVVRLQCRQLKCDSSNPQTCQAFPLSLYYLTENKFKLENFPLFNYQTKKGKERFGGKATKAPTVAHLVTKVTLFDLERNRMCCAGYVRLCRTFSVGTRAPSPSCWQLNHQLYQPTAYRVTNCFLSTAIILYYVSLSVFHSQFVVSAVATSF